MEIFRLGAAKAGFSTRFGGASIGCWESFNLGEHVGDDLLAVAHNRGLLQKFVDRKIVWMNQTHSTTAVLIDGPVVGPVDGDAIVIDARDRERWADLASASGYADLRPWAAAVMVADCVPLLISGPGVVAAVHAGRVGAAGHIVMRTLETMSSLGIDLGRCEAAIGPSACGKCYEVNKELWDEVGSELANSRSRTAEGKFALDIAQGVISELEDAKIGGIVTENWRCTVENESYFSYRRSGKTGRQVGVVVP